MAKARKTQISLDATSYYHCVSRCVRKALLCGRDNHTGQDYEHRRQWIEDRLLLLAEVFAIDLCAYAVMSNHVHTVLHINAAEANHLTDLEVCERWHRLYKGTVLTQKYARQDPMNKAEQVAVKMRIDQWRLNLFDISKFMKALNEPIARMANAEDKCTGRFWEGRFKSQALCDEAALAACMAYVDLNPIRAKMAETPETSDHTSIKQRITAAKSNQFPENLAQFVGNPREPMPQGLPFTLMDYIELVDWTGRVMRDDKRGHISSTLPPIIDRLGIEPDNWLELTRAFEKNTKTFVGSGDHIESAAFTMGYKRTPKSAALSVVVWLISRLFPFTFLMPLGLTLRRYIACCSISELLIACVHKAACLRLYLKILLGQMQKAGSFDCFLKVSVFFGVVFLAPAKHV